MTVPIFADTGWAQAACVFGFSRRILPEVVSELAAIRGRTGGLAREGSREEQAAALHSTILRRYEECASDENGRAMVAE